MTTTAAKLSIRTPKGRAWQLALRITLGVILAFATLNAALLILGLAALSQPRRAL